jgi:Membrane protease subunits, stomatin/prohibitin homologs
MKNVNQLEEIQARSSSGMAALILNLLFMIATTAVCIFGGILIESGTIALGVTLLVVGCIYVSIVGPILFAGLKILKPNEALVLTLFGKYIGTLKGPGYFFVNPFSSSMNPAKDNATSAEFKAEVKSGKTNEISVSTQISKKLSLKTMTLNNDKQKINDLLGNPIEIGIVVIWRIVNTAKAVFNVENYTEYLSIQCDSALRNIVRMYPYDINSDADNEKSLRGSSQEIADKLKEEIQMKVEVAGLEIVEARITNLSYAPEIAAVMLQRQQASAVVDARQMIVEGAVGMVEMALRQLSENGIVDLDEERKAAMVSNLLVVLCGNKDAQPIVNSGSIY